MFKFDWYDDGSVFNFEVDLCGINWQILVMLNKCGKLKIWKFMDLCKSWMFK